MREFQIPLDGNASADLSAAIALGWAAERIQTNVLQLPVHEGEEAWLEWVDGTAGIAGSPSCAPFRHLHVLPHIKVPRHGQPVGTRRYRRHAELASFDLKFDPATHPALPQHCSILAAPYSYLGVKAGRHGPALQPSRTDHAASYKVKASIDLDR